MRSAIATARFAACRDHDAAPTTGSALVAFVVGAMLFTGCRGEHHGRPPDPHAGSGSAASSTPPPVIVPALPRSTNSAGELGLMTERIERNPDHPAIAIAALLDRATYLGRLDDYRDALARSATWIAHEPKLLEAWLARVQTLAAVHEFAAARTALATAAKLALEPSAVHEAALSLDEAIGARDRVLAEREAAAHAYPNAVNLTRYAALLALAGRADEASALIPRAAQEIHNNTATIFAWLLFQWGRVYELAGNLGAARQFYAEAHARFPEYVEATAHLAQTALATGDHETATHVVKDALATSPPHHPALVELGAQLGLVTALEARSAWDRYVAALPLAFADHAARFYLGVGADPKRALELAQQNFANRDVPEARALVVEAALAAKDEGAACAAAPPLATAPLRAHRFMAWRALSRPACKSGDVADRLAKDLGITK